MPVAIMTSQRRQQGVAIVTALIVVAAATTAVAGMMWRQSVEQRRIENQAALGQSRWLARSALDWARLVLLQDARTSSVDHLGETWAIPLAETRIADPDAPDDSSAAAFVSGSIVDEQARLNLVALDGGGVPNDKETLVLARLLAILGQPPEAAQTIALRMATPPRPGDFRQLVRDMGNHQAVPASVLQALEPYVTVLPKATPVNLNTAGPEVIAACYEDMTLDQARALTRSRERAYFNQISDVNSRLSGIASASHALTSVGVASNFFEAHGRILYRRIDLDVGAIISRSADGSTRVVRWTEN